MTATLLSPTQKEKTQQAAKLLKQAEKSVRILRTVSWPPEVRERFFAREARELPVVTYPRFDPSESLELVAAARRSFPGVPLLDAWLERIAEALACGARMLAATGTAEFAEHSRSLYGDPGSSQLDHKTTSLALARQLDEVLGGLEGLDLGAPDPACHLAWAVAERMRAAVTARFGKRAPEVAVVETLSANALAGPRAIRLRRTACFTDRDVLQLIHHEAYIHVATALNGEDQASLPILAGHPGTTSTQEGLAVFAELVSGTLDPSRLRRLAERVLAIQAALDGADFLEVYRFFSERGYEDEQAFESARRVFRGGVLTGGAPFTKDVVYLHGLLRVHNFLRSAIAARRHDCVHLLFCGKIDLEDLPALALLASEGLLAPPTFLPPWADDMRFLVAYLAYSAFLNRVDLGHVRAHYETLLAQSPDLSAWSDRRLANSGS
jgi:uncharacterized protein (TIGR02421 family)